MCLNVWRDINSAIIVCNNFFGFLVEFFRDMIFNCFLVTMFVVWDIRCVLNGDILFGWFRILDLLKYF